MSFVCGVLQCGDHRVRDFASRGLAAQIRAMIGFVRHDCLDARQEAARGLLLTKVIEQQSTGPEGPDRVGNSLACDIKSRTMDGLEHRRVFSLWVEVCRRCDAERTGQRRSKIGENIRVQVCRHDSVERVGFEGHACRHCIDQHLVPTDIREVLRNLGGDFIPHDHPMALSIGFVTTVKSLRGRERANSKAKRMIRVTPVRV